ncbi:MAG: 8-oxo-dGTP diphosphatase [Polaribacter sp.]|jgi:8-oxo-dGTP diphosphatase
MSKERVKAFYTQADRLLLAVDCIIFGFAEERLKLLLFKRKVAPFKNKWSLIGSFVNAGESVSVAAKRVLQESTGLTNVFMEELGCFGAHDRDPGDRVVSMAHYALIRLEEREEQLVESYQAHWFDVDDIPELILDHKQMVKAALEKLKRKALYQPIGFELLPQKFTIPQLKNLYDAIYEKKLDRRNFRKKILASGVLKKLEEKDKSTSKKGAFLYCFDKDKYETLEVKSLSF